MANFTLRIRAEKSLQITTSEVIKELRPRTKRWRKSRTLRKKTQLGTDWVNRIIMDNNRWAFDSSERLWTT